MDGTINKKYIKNQMLSTHHSGWSIFSLGNEKYKLSYLTDVAYDWLEQAIHGLETSTPFVVHGYCEPDRMMCVVDYWNCHIILSKYDDCELNEKNVTYDNVHVNMLDFCKMLVRDISNDIEVWADWTCEHFESEEEELNSHNAIKEKLLVKLKRLNELIDENEKYFKDGNFLG